MTTYNASSNLSVIVLGKVVRNVSATRHIGLRVPTAEVGRVSVKVSEFNYQTISDAQRSGNNRPKWPEASWSIPNLHVVTIFVVVNVSFFCFFFFGFDFLVCIAGL